MVALVVGDVPFVLEPADRRRRKPDHLALEALRFAERRAYLLHRGNGPEASAAAPAVQQVVTVTRREAASPSRATRSNVGSRKLLVAQTVGLGCCGRGCGRAPGCVLGAGVGAASVSCPGPAAVALLRVVVRCSFDVF